MPSEIRHILFQEAEVGKALRFYRERTGTVVKACESPVYTIERVGSGEEVRFTMTMGAGPTSQTLSAAGSELAAALILYCRSQRIPLPAGASKSLQRFGGHLCLVVTSNAGGGSLPNVTAPS